ncbi:glycosyl hydrolase [Streptococcus gordonii]|uniref:glycosyl hydrolase n=1 Tax=Streptococcus gordonii TaxID=1302 RepID=UPI0007796FDA|nr:glycosyl hydrolase [Streptococcus gordonii]
MKKSFSKYLVTSLTVSGVFLFAPLVLAEESLDFSVQHPSPSSLTSENMIEVSEAKSDGVNRTEAEISKEDPTEPTQATVGKSEESRTLNIVDTQATQETKELFAYLKDLNQKKDILFGQQHALDEGLTLTQEGSRTGSKESDVKNAVGDYPAVFGWDTLSIDGHEKPGVEGDVQKSIQNLSTSMKTAHELGGILTLSTHPYNFVTGGDFKDTSGNVVAEILPGGRYNDKFNAWLDNIASLANSLRTADNRTIPFIFRPFHEQTGSWFWWGESTTNPEQYKALYRYTVEYLRDKKEVHNILYAYSPGAGNERYLKTYPGDDYVDIFGIDSYDDKSNAGSESYITSLLKDSRMLAGLAEQKGKIAALTEFGYSAQGIKDKGNTLDWYTRIFQALKNDPQASKIAYMMTWANFGRGNNLYTPYRDINGNLGGDHELLADFQKFYQDSNSIFSKEVGKVYETGKKFETVPQKGHRYLIQPANQGVVSNKQFSLVTKALKDDTRVTYSFGNSEEIDLQKSDDYFSGQVKLPENINKQALPLILRYYKTNVLQETQSHRLFVKIQVEPVSPYLVDDFEDYLGENDLLEKAYSSNGDPIKISLVKSSKDGGQYAMAYDYTIANNGYAERQISFDKSWEKQNALVFDIQSESQGNRHLTVQIQMGGISFEKDLDLNQSLDKRVTIPFTEFKPAAWESNQKAQVTQERLKKVTQFAFYMGGDKGHGRIYFDNIQAVQDADSLQVPEKEVATPYKPLEFLFNQPETNWLGNNVRVQEGNLQADVSAKEQEKTELKLSQGQDLTNHNWFVARVKSTVPVSAKLFLKVGENWQWVNSEAQVIDNQFVNMKFNISNLENKDKVRELGIEFAGLSDKEKVAVVSLSFVEFVQNLNELDTEMKNTNKSDLNNQSNLVQHESTLVVDSTNSNKSDLNKQSNSVQYESTFVTDSTNSSVSNVQTIRDGSQKESKISKKNLTGEERARLPRTGQRKDIALSFLGIFIILFNYLLIGKQQSKKL